MLSSQRKQPSREKKVLTYSKEMLGMAKAKDERKRWKYPVFDLKTSHQPKVRAIAKQGTCKKTLTNDLLDIG